MNRTPVSYEYLEKKHDTLVSHVLREKFHHIMERLTQRLERSNLQPNRIKMISDLLRDLRMRFLSSQNQLRLLQKEAFWRLLIFIASGKTYGYFKLPTGVGKTRLFLEIIGALGRNKLVLVPKENLVENTYSQAVGNSEEGYEKVKGFTRSNTHPVYARPGTRVENTVEKILIGMRENETIIMTLATFVKIHNEAPRVFGMLTDKIDIVISDEIHRLLGKKTQEALTEVMGEETLQITEESEVEILEVEKYTEEMQKIHLGFTGTPKLSMKGVDDYAECIYSINLEAAIRYNQIVLPTAHRTGEAIRYLDPIEDVDILKTLSAGGKLSQAQLALIGEKYQSEDGRPYSERAIEEYIQVKRKMFREQGFNKFPAVFFCASIGQAEGVKQRLCKLGIPAVRCTSGNDQFTKGISPGEAKKGIKAGKIETVVTVSQVGEGWDVPELRCAVWLRPSDSPAVILQGDGRIMRLMEGKNTSNTYIIAPNKWVLKTKEPCNQNTRNLGKTKGFPKNSGDRGKNREKKDESKTTILGERPHNMELWIQAGEVSWSFLHGHGNDKSIIGYQTMNEYYFLEKDKETGISNLEKDYIAFKQANDGKFTSKCKNSFQCANGETLTPLQWLYRISNSFYQEIGDTPVTNWIQIKLGIKNIYIDMNQDYFSQNEFSNLKEDYLTGKKVNQGKFSTWTNKPFKCKNGQIMKPKKWLQAVQKAFSGEIILKSRDERKKIIEWIEEKIGVKKMDREYFLEDALKNLIYDYEEFRKANGGKFSSQSKQPFLTRSGEILTPVMWLQRIRKAFPNEISPINHHWSKSIKWVEEKIGKKLQYTNMDREYFTINDSINLYEDYRSLLTENKGRFATNCKTPFLCKNGQTITPVKWLRKIQRAFCSEIEQGQNDWAKAIPWVKKKLNLI